LRRFVVPLPPLAEQDRIVVKVHELMALCDRLEGSLFIAETTRSRLLGALIADALAPVAGEPHVTH
jgi:type I restriction enzyme S subunit